MLKAVAALRNYSLDGYYISPECSEGHLGLWKAGFERRGLWLMEWAVQNYTLSGLLEVLENLNTPSSIHGCGCRGLNPELPQNLRDAVCQTLDQFHAA